MMKINDSLGDILDYLNAAINFVCNIIERNAQLNVHVCPFQFDACIAVGPPIERKENDDSKG